MANMSETQLITQALDNFTKELKGLRTDQNSSFERLANIILGSSRSARFF
jgi:hypothetical protein